jgi:hypothetical protein
MHPLHLALDDLAELGLALVQHGGVVKRSPFRRRADIKIKQIW